MNDLKDFIVKHRRHIHQNPELGFNTQNTAAYIANILKELGYEVNLRMNDAAIIATLNLGKDETYAFRSDLDALKICEMTNLEFKSTNGAMHACGHDGHMATLLGAAKLMSENKEKLTKNIVLLFQPAEEGPLPGGAFYLKDDPILKQVDRFFAYHVTKKLYSGQIGIKSLEATASPDLWELELTGIGCHGSTPSLGNNPILPGSMIALEFEKLYQELLKNYNLVITTTYISSGVSMNIILDKCYLKGTARSFKEEHRHMLKEKMTEVIDKVCKKYNVTYKFDFHFAYPPVLNDLENERIIKEAASKVLEKENIISLEKPELIGEDFAYYREIAPICLTWLGTRNKNEQFLDLHNEKFSVDEDSLVYGAKILYNTVI